LPPSESGTISSTFTRGVLSGDKARLSNGELGLFTVLILPDLLVLFVGDITVPPAFVARGDGLLTEAEFNEGVLASGETGIQDIDRLLGE